MGVQSPGKSWSDFPRSTPAPEPTPPSTPSPVQQDVKQQDLTNSPTIAAMLDSYTALQGLHRLDEEQQRLFTQQLNQELRAQQDALADRQEFVESTSRRGMASSIGVMQEHIHIWARRLSYLLDSELQQVGAKVCMGMSCMGMCAHAC